MKFGPLIAEMDDSDCDYTSIVHPYVIILAGVRPSYVIILLVIVHVTQNIMIHYFI